MLRVAVVVCQALAQCLTPLTPCKKRRKQRDSFLRVADYNAVVELLSSSTGLVVT